MSWGHRAGARGAAVVVSGLLVGAGALVAAAPAYAVSEPFSCKVLTTTVQWSADANVTFTPAKPKVGDNVSAVLELGSFKNGPVPVKANDLVPKATVSANGKTTVINGGAITSVIPAESDIAIPKMKFSFVAKDSNEIKVTKVFFDHPQVDTTCTPTGETTVATLTATGTQQVQQPQAKPPAQQPASPAKPAQKPPATPRELGRTGPEETRNMLIVSLVALQLGLILVVRMNRRSPKSRAVMVNGPAVRVRVRGKK